MATPTPLAHPRAALQRDQFYPFTVSVKTMSGQAVVGPLPCAYDAATGGEPGTFEDEAPADDKILIPSWQPTIEAKAQAILNMLGTRKKFQIVDVVPQGAPPAQTLLIVSPI